MSSNPPSTPKAFRHHYSSYTNIGLLTPPATPQNSLIQTPPAPSPVLIDSNPSVLDELEQRQVGDDVEIRKRPPTKRRYNHSVDLTPQGLGVRFNAPLSYEVLGVLSARGSSEKLDHHYLSRALDDKDHQEGSKSLWSSLKIQILKLRRSGYLIPLVKISGVIISLLILLAIFSDVTTTTNDDIHPHGLSIRRFRPKDVTSPRKNTKRKSLPKRKRQTPASVDRVDKYLAQKYEKAQASAAQAEAGPGLSGRANKEHNTNGLVYIDVDQSGKSRHPIFDLIANATEDYSSQQQKVPSDESEATALYEEAFHRHPPSNYDMLGPSFPSPPIALLPYHSVAAFKLRSDQLRFENELYSEFDQRQSIFILVVADGKMSSEFPFGEKFREEAERLVDLMKEYENVLEDLRIAVDVTGGSFPTIVPFEITEERTKAALLGNYENPKVASRCIETSLKQVCDPSSLYRKPAADVAQEVEEGPGLDAPDYIHLAIPSTDICQHPSLITLNPTLSYLALHEPSLLATKRQLRPVPILTPWKLSASSNVLASLIALSNGRAGLSPDEDGNHVHFVPWAKKNKSRAAQRRGESIKFLTPGDKSTEWFTSTATYAQSNTKWRVNLLNHIPLPHAMPLVVAPETGADEGFILEGTTPNIFEEMGVIDSAMHTAPDCDGEVGCHLLSSRIRTDTTEWNHSEERFVMVLEDESPRDVFLGGSVVMYAGVSQQSWMHKAIPWYHYVPVQADFSDLLSIMLFFRKYPTLAAQIASQGHQFAQEHLNLEQEKKEFLGLLLEYGRIWNES